MQVFPTMSGGDPDINMMLDLLKKLSPPRVGLRSSYDGRFFVQQKVQWL